MRIKVYQINPDEDRRNLSFLNYSHFEKSGGIDPTEYKCVFHGFMDCFGLEEIYEKLNIGERPGNYKGHSLSVSDIVEVIDDNSPDWDAFEETAQGRAYSVAKLIVTKAFGLTIDKDMDSFPGNIADPLSDWAFSERERLLKVIGEEAPALHEEAKPYVIPLIKQWASYVPTWILDAYGWEQKNVIDTMIQHIEESDIQEFARTEFAADDIAVDTEAQAVCDEVNALNSFEKRQTLTETHFVPFAPKGAYFCDSFGFKSIDFDGCLAKQLEGIRCLEIQPHKMPFETRIEDNLPSLQNAVSDHQEDSLIEFTYPFEDNAILLGNEEAKLIGMEGNRRICGSIYAGPLYVVGDDGQGGLCDLTEEQIREYTTRFAIPEDISQDEVQGDVGFTITNW